VAHPSGRSPHLGHKLGTLDYFTLGFGSMVGVGWLVVIDDWLLRGGPVGAALGFLIGGVLLIPVALTYARLVTFVPDAGAEVAYTERVLPRPVSFVTGWIMTLAYLIVCPYEAVAIGRLLSRPLPQLDGVVLYSVGGQPIYLWRLIVGVVLTLWIGWINYRGIRLSATFQGLCTFGLLAVFAVFSGLGFARGSGANLQPWFGQPGGWGAALSVVLVLQIVPYFMTGFESATKTSEEARHDFRAGGFYRAILWSIGAGTGFYVLVVLVVGLTYPWRALTELPFGTAVAFERAFDSRRLGDLIFFGAVLSLLKVYNGNFVAATRLIYGLGKRGLVHSGLAAVHPHHLTPHAAIGLALAVTLLGALLGDAVLVPISEVGSLAVAVGWLATCVCFLRGVSWAEGGAPTAGPLWAARVGALVAAGLILMKLLPFVPGHLSGPEWLALASWMGLGVLLWRLRRRG
jgi:amino acid transporter